MQRQINLILKDYFSFLRKILEIKNYQHQHNYRLQFNKKLLSK